MSTAFSKKVFLFFLSVNCSLQDHASQTVDNGTVWFNSAGHDQQTLLQKVIVSNYGRDLGHEFNTFLANHTKNEIPDFEVPYNNSQQLAMFFVSHDYVPTSTPSAPILVREENRVLRTYQASYGSLSNENSFGISSGQLSKPKPLSVLMNFGLDGISQWSGSSLDEKSDFQKDCPEGSVYDPFGCVCRPTVCVPVENIMPNIRSAVGDFDDDKCVSITSNYRRTVRISPNATDANITIFLGLNNATADFDRLRDVHPEKFRDNVEVVFGKELVRLLTSNMNIHESQISNVKVSEFLAGGNCSKYDLADSFLDTGQKLNKKVTFCESISDHFEPLVQVPAYFTLTRPRELRNVSESVVEMFVFLAELIQNKSFVFNVSGFAVEAQGIQECTKHKNNPIFMDTSFCSRGAVQTYYNEEFNVTDLGNNTRVFVKSTQKEYGPGEFRFQVLIRSENKDRLHVSQVAHTCDRPLNCTAFEALGAKVQKNQTVLFNNRTYDITEYYRHPHDPARILICGQALTVRTNIVKNIVLGFDMRPELSIISTTLTVVSVVALLLTLSIYFLFQELRTLPGLNLMNAMVAMVIGQSALLLNSVADTKFCHAIGIITHYAFLLGFFFANVIAWDFYRTFGRTRSLHTPNITSRQSIRKRLLCNMAYCYISSACIVSAAVVLDYYDIEKWRVGYADLCWIAGARASLVFYALPIAVIVILNAILIIVTFCKMQTHERSLNTMHVISGRRALSREQKIKREILTYVRIGSVLGFMWFFGIAAGLVRNLIPQHHGYLLAYEIFIYVFLFTQSNQGLFIFIAFGINTRNRKRIRNLWSRWNVKGCKVCQRQMCICRVLPQFAKTESNQSLQSSATSVNRPETSSP